MESENQPQPKVSTPDELAAIIFDQLTDEGCTHQQKIAVNRALNALIRKGLDDEITSLTNLRNQI